MNYQQIQRDLFKAHENFLKLERGLSPNSIEAYVRDVDKLHRFADDLGKSVLNITYDDLQQFVAQLRDIGIHPRSQARIISGIKSFYHYLVLENYLDADPTEFLESPKIGMRLPEVLSVDEINAILASIDLSKPEGHRNRAMLEVLYSCGLRVSELVNLRYSDVYRREQFIRVWGKGSKQRLVPLAADEMQEVLSVYQWMRRKITQPDFGFTREIVRCYMQVLVHNGYQWLARHHREQPDAERPQNRPQELFERFLALVQKHYAEERSIRFYADRLCLTPKYLSNAVHRVSGRHAGEWIKDYVLLEAKALLKSRQYTVQQVSEMLNFPNTSFFGKFFKKAVGCTPRTYMLG